MQARIVNEIRQSFVDHWLAYLSLFRQPLTLDQRLDNNLIDKETSNANQQQASYQIPVYAHEVHGAISGESATSLTQERI